MMLNKMRSKGILWVLFFSILLIGCASSQKVVEANPALDAMIDKKEIQIMVTSAHPFVTNAMSQVAQSGLVPPGSTINRIDVSGGSNIMSIMGDSVSANLAYYGERRMGGGYNNTPGIKFNGVPTTLEIIKDETKNKYQIKFSIEEQSEAFDVFIQLFPNLSGTIDVISSHRTNISYSGRAQALEQ